MRTRAGPHRFDAAIPRRPELQTAVSPHFARSAVPDLARLLRRAWCIPLDSARK
jgi:hypothetical protein